MTKGKNKRRNGIMREIEFWDVDLEALEFGGDGGSVI